LSIVATHFKPTRGGKQMGVGLLVGVYFGRLKVILELIKRLSSQR